MSSNRPKILWVDDESLDILEPLAKRIMKAGVTVDRATSYTEAFHRLGETSYSAVMIDVILPFSEGSGLLASDLGLRLAEDIRKDRVRKASEESTKPTIPIIILSVVRFDDIKGQTKGLNVQYFDKRDLLAPGVLRGLINALRNTPENDTTQKI